MFLPHIRRQLRINIVSSALEMLCLLLRKKQEKENLKTREEKRKHKRLELDVTVELERLDEDGVTTLRYSHVEVVDISRTGIGFKAGQRLEVGTHYNTKIQIWTKEIIDVVIEIVRCEELEDGYRYGGIFIGMSNTDALKIDIYQIFNDI